jgi:hypothetical protein
MVRLGVQRWVQGFGSVGWPVRTSSSVGVAREGSETAGLAVLAADSLQLRGWLSCDNGSMSGVAARYAPYSSVPEGYYGRCQHD